jgi:hypothetical protein
VINPVPREEGAMEQRRSDWLEVGGSSAFQARLRRVSAFVVAVRRRTGEEGDELRANVLADVKDALGGDEPTAELIEVEGFPGPQACITTEGVFRNVLEDFGLDRTDPRTQESFWEAARRAVDEVLSAQGG